MDQHEQNENECNHNVAKLWIGIAAGAAIGVGIALSRRKRRTRWDTARELTRRVTDRSGDLTSATKDMVARARLIYSEGLKLVEDATEVWTHGRKFVGY